MQVNPDYVLCTICFEVGECAHSWKAVEKEWRKETTNLIVRVAEELIVEYEDAFNKKAVMRGFRKKVRRILNRGDRQ